MNTIPLESLLDAVAFAESSPVLISLSMERLGVRVSARRLEDDPRGRAVVALRCDRFVSWQDLSLTARFNPILDTIKNVEAQMGVQRRGEGA